MQIKIKTMQKTEHPLEVSGPDATVGEVRKLADSAIGSSGVTLIFLGNVLKDDAATLGSVNVQEGASIVALAKKAKTAAPAAAPAASPAAPAPAPAAPSPQAPVTYVPAPAQPAAAAAAPAAPAPQGSGVFISLTVADASGDVRNVEVESNESVENIKAILEVEFNVPLARQQLLFEGQPLADAQRIDAAGIKDNDMLLLQVGATPRPQSARPATAGAPAGAGGALPPGGLFGNLFSNLGRAPPDPLQRFMGQAEEIMQMAEIDLHFKRQLGEQDPEMAQALEAKDKTAVARKLMELAKKKMENESRKQAAIMRLNADPLDVEAQKEIENAIAMENINENYTKALEYNPEAFGHIVMLYVPCEVNETPINAFVDSGAQMTVMSQPVATRLGIMRLCDKRYAGVARGVGSSKIVGKIHACNMKLGNQYFTISITVLEDNSMDFLFGLDNLRRHQCCIDLKDNVLRIGDDAVPFLGESEIPKGSIGAAGDVEMSDAPAAAGGGGGGQDYPPETIERFTSMGFSKEQAVAALRQSGGDPELAASLLLSGFD